MLHLLKYQRCTRQVRLRTETASRARKFSGWVIFCLAYNLVTTLLSVQPDYKRDHISSYERLNGHSNKWKQMEFVDELFSDAIPDEVVLLQDNNVPDINLDELFGDTETPHHENGGLFNPHLEEGLLDVEPPAAEIELDELVPDDADEATPDETDPAPRVNGKVNGSNGVPTHVPHQEPEPQPKVEDTTSKAGFKAPRTILIDASPIVHAAYHRLDVLTAPGTSIPIHGIYGFMRKLLFYMKTYEYDYIGLCLDSARSFRKDIFPGYKANRSAQDAVCI